MNRKKEAVLWSFVVAGLIVSFSYTGLCDEQEITEKQEMEQYSKEMNKYVEQATVDLAETKKYFDKEDSQYANYNDILLELKQKEIDIMKKIAQAAKDNDKSKIKQYEKEQEETQYQLTLTSLKKEMAQTLYDAEKRASQYPLSERITSGISKLRKSYAALIKAHMEEYRASTNLKRAYKAKDDAQKICEINFLEAEKQKKIKEVLE